MSLARRAGERALRARAALALASLALALLAHGCAPGPAQPPRPPVPRRAAPAPARRPKPGYEQRVDELRTADTVALVGRRIALDPGHGGVFRGALGVNGLTEAEVNLGVALHLRGLLEARGAQVFMTRTDDRDFLVPADSSLRADLAERIRLANEVHPDLFVSIHHNADARGAHDVNETQTYYKLGDEGSSLDAAESVHRFLVRNLGIEKHRIVPGNYFVLRNSEAPAILTESSYLTNPDVESKLALAAKQRLEAEALFLGIAHYFARPRPVIQEFAILADGRRHGGPPSRPDTVFSVAGEPRFEGRIGGAFDRAELLVDGRRVPLVRAGASVRSDGQTPEPGEHVAELRVGLAGAGSAPAATLRFRMEPRTVQGVFATAFPASPSSRVGTLGVRVRLELPGGFGYPDSVRVRLATSARCLAPAETTVVTRDGSAWAYFRPVPGRPWKGDERGLIHVVPRLLGARGLPQPVEATVVVAPADRAPRCRGVLLRAMPGDTALAGAPGTDERRRVTFEPSDPSRWINRDGFAVFDLDSSGRAIVPRLPGYRPWALDPAAPAPAVPARWAAIAGGALLGERVVIDPDGGGDDDGGTGPSGTRAANLNLEVARALAGFLEAAGAEARLTRDGDVALSDVERVQIGEAFHADRFLRIAHRAEPPSLGYYFSSAAGKSWAERAGETLLSLGLPAPRAVEDAQYPLQQTSCPALFASLARIDDPGTEERLASPAAVRAEAYALYVALARERAPAALWPVDSLEVRGDDGQALAGAAVTLGGSLTLMADEQGRVHFARTEPGPLEIEVQHPRLRVRRVLLDSQSSVVLTGSPGR